ncbi:MAG: HIT family protein [Planctomycetaceae bacterium]|jgi:ATP adenylyltransferase
MSHDTLWAPWRLSYIKSPNRPASGHCFLCEYRDHPEQDRENLVLLRGNTCSVVLNRFPYNNGHLLVAPYAHKAHLTELSDSELLECSQYLREMTSVLSRAMSPDGFNIGLNLGKVAGAGLPGHLHWHIVPRWNGDTNFMPVLADVNVIPQSLEALYDLLQSSIRG